MAAKHDPRPAHMTQPLASHDLSTPPSAGVSRQNIYSALDLAAGTPGLSPGTLIQDHRKALVSTAA